MQQLGYSEAAKLSLGDLRRYMLWLGFSTATKLSKRGMLFVLQRYPNGPKSSAQQLAERLQAADPDGNYGWTS